MTQATQHHRSALRRPTTKPLPLRKPAQPTPPLINSRNERHITDRATKSDQQNNHRAPRHPPHKANCNEHRQSLKSRVPKLPKSLCKHIQILTQERPQQLLSASQAHQNPPKHLHITTETENTSRDRQPQQQVLTDSKADDIRPAQPISAALRTSVKSDRTKTLLNNKTKPAYPHSPTRKASEPRNAKWSTTRDALLKTPSFSAIQAPSSHIRSKNGSLNPLTTAPVHA